MNRTSSEYSTVQKNSMISHCDVCGAPLQTRFKLGFRALLGSDAKQYTQHIGICPDCGLIVTQNPFTPEQLERRYRNDSKFEYDSEQCVGELTEHYKAQCLCQKHFIEESLGNKHFESIFEVGAASGYNLSIYPGKVVTGLEPSLLNCRLAKERYHIDLIPMLWQEYYRRTESRQYDLIFLSMVLEHIVNPCRFILECSEICSGYLFIDVPTLDYKTMEEPYGMFCEEHVNIFTLESLTSLMQSAGFSLINAELYYGFDLYLPAGYPSIRTLWRKGDRAVKRKAMFSSSELLDRYLSVSAEQMKSICSLVDRIPDRERLALWGIGHHVSMLLANTNLSRKNIVRIYDSDPKKTGIPFWETEILPFSAADTEENRVEAILITTYTAQKSITKAVLASGYRGKIYTLYHLSN